MHISKQITSKVNLFLLIVTSLLLSWLILNFSINKQPVIQNIDTSEMDYSTLQELHRLEPGYTKAKSPMIVWIRTIKEDSPTLGTIYNQELFISSVDIPSPDEKVIHSFELPGSYGFNVPNAINIIDDRIIASYFIGMKKDLLIANIDGEIITNSIIDESGYSEGSWYISSYDKDSAVLENLNGERKNVSFDLITGRLSD